MKPTHLIHCTPTTYEPSTFAGGSGGVRSGDTWQRCDDASPRSRDAIIQSASMSLDCISSLGILPVWALARLMMSNEGCPYGMRNIKDRQWRLSIGYQHLQDCNFHQSQSPQKTGAEAYHHVTGCDLSPSQWSRSQPNRGILRLYVQTLYRVTKHTVYVLVPCGQHKSIWPCVW